VVVSRRGGAIRCKVPLKVYRMTEWVCLRYVHIGRRFHVDGSLGEEFTRRRSIRRRGGGQSWTRRRGVDRLDGDGRSRAVCGVRRDETDSSTEEGAARTFVTFVTAKFARA